MIAAAGAHNLLMLGPPGSGKSEDMPRYATLESATPWRWMRNHVVLECADEDARDHARTEEIVPQLARFPDCLRGWARAWDLAASN